MSEKQFERLLHRELHIHDVEEHCTPQLELLRDVVNYGTNLIPACLTSSSRGLGDVIVITVLLKQIVRMLDAFEVLASAACVPALTLQARAILETSLYLEWMLKAEAEKKALYYHVSNTRKERHWFSRMVAGSQERSDFETALGGFAQAMKLSTENIAAVSAERIKAIDEFLAKEPYAKINSEFDKAKGNRPDEPAWHKPLGKPSVRSIAKELGRLPDYEVFYAQFSENMHGSRHRAHITIGKGKIVLEPLRNLEQFRVNVCYALCLAFRAYPLVLEKYRPGQLEEFRQHYLRDWQSPFMNMKEIKYRAAEITTIITSETGKVPS